MKVNENPFVQGKILHLIARKPGFQGKVDESLLGDLPKEILRVGQDRLDRSILKEMDGLKNKTKNRLAKKAINLGVPGVDILLIPPSKMEEVEEILEETKKEWLAMGRSFCDAYEDLKKDFERQYPDYFDPEKYPDVLAVWNRFYFGYSFYSLDVPNGEMQVSEVSSGEISLRRRRFLEELAEMERTVLNFVAQEIKQRLCKAVEKYDERGAANANVMKSVGKFLSETYNGLYEGFLFDEKLKALIEGELAPFVNGVQTDRVSDDPVYQAEIVNTAEILAAKIDEIAAEASKAPLRAMDF